MKLITSLNTDSITGNLHCAFPVDLLTDYALSMLETTPNIIETDKVLDYAIKADDGRIYTLRMKPAYLISHMMNYLDDIGENPVQNYALLLSGYVTHDKNGDFVLNNARFDGLRSLSELE